MFDNVFETVNSGFAQALYEDYLRDPESVPPEWRELFENGLQGEQPTEPAEGDAATPTAVGTGAEPGTSRAAEPAAATAPPHGATEIKGPALRLLQNMEASLTVPTATSFRDIDVAVLWETRAALNGQLKTEGIKLSFTHLIGWALVQAVQAFPVMAHSLSQQGSAFYRVEPDGINLGLAVDVEGRGGQRKLLVPVIKRADRMTFREFFAEYERLVAGARDNKLMPDAYIGGTVTLTNPGTLGTVASVPRLMKGQGSIVATGAISNVGGSRVMTVTSTYDHRIIQGAESGMFLREIDRRLQGEERFYQEVAEAVGVSVASSAVESTPGAASSDAGVSAVAAPIDTARLAEAVPAQMLYHVAAAMSLVKAHRTHGYLDAHLDPLGTKPIGDPALHPEPLGLTPEIMAQIPASVLRVYVDGETLLQALPRLRETYRGTIAYEIEHIASHKERVWLRRVIESGQHRAPLTDERKRQLLSGLIRTDTLERFLHRTYLGQKRFGIEGLEMLVPMLEHTLELASEQGARDIVMGMAHRGRLNVLTHILGVPYDALLAEFEGEHDVEETLATGRGTGDVKYHYGANGTFQTRSGKKVDVILMPNPSHVEAVNPVVEGHVRASQTDRLGEKLHHDPKRVLAVLMHGDAAFAAQGVVAETFNLAKLDGYDTGGTLHIITNNQIGFTTSPREARSTDFASDLAKGFDVPIVHVNADDPEACLAAIRLAMMYREEFRNDCVINLVGYRRYGHNEGDEPRYTQPVMYDRIDKHTPVMKLYAKTLIDGGVVAEEQILKETDAEYQKLSAALERIRAEKPDDRNDEPMRMSGEWTMVAEPETVVDADVLLDLNDQLLRVPDGFTINPKLKRVLDRRTAMAGGGEIDWGHAEALALGTLVLEGIPIRLTGQDTRRGTFSHRHITLFDMNTGEAYTPIQHLKGATSTLEVLNSPLSEYGALGFEYGYSVAAPETLVLWEAQFGDFVNGAQIVTDQFIIAGLAKWGETSRLVLLLPHGYEGQGPEHSSARLERFLALGAEGNIRVANCSTPAQYFHLLRRQAKHLQLRPLVLMTPKSLLRHPKTFSTLDDLVKQSFRHVLDDTTLPADRDDVTRIVLCSGKVYYDAVTAKQRPEAKHVAIGRIELLYPFPQEAVAALINAYPNAREIVWLQEEPTNMGARKWVVPQLIAMVAEDVRVRHVARPERSSPAEGYLNKHLAEQARLVAEVLV